MTQKETISDGQLSQVVKQQNLKKPIRWVIGLHIFVIIVAAFGLPRFKKEPFDITQAVNVDLIAPNADVSAAPNKSHSKEPFKPQAKTDTAKKPPVSKPEKPPETVRSDAAKKDDTPVPPKPVEKPTPPQPKEKPPEKETPKEKPDDKPALKKAPPKKVEKPKPKATPKKSKDDGAGQEQDQKQFNSLLKNLIDADPKVSAPEGNPVDKPFDDSKPQGEAPVTSDTLSLSDMDALKYQLGKCWNVPTGAMNAEDLIVDIRVEVRQDRTVLRAEIVDQGRYNSDDFFRAAADSAKRALFNPLCTPLNLPPDKYDTWKDILIRFNPKEMLGG